MRAAEVRRVAEKAQAQALRAHESLPFRLPTLQRGRLGALLGKGAGSSIEYHDHRPYTAGDNPRHIDWSVYARSGNYSMKLFREEIAPELELLVDLSHSMALQEAKLQRALELCYWLVLSAESHAARLRCTFFAEAGAQPISRVDLLALELPGCGGEPNFSALALRPSSYRVLITDLLWPQDPKPLLECLLRDRGQLLLLAPYLQEEAEPRWSGRMQLTDCETEQSTLQQVDGNTLAQYQAAYQRHMQRWAECCQSFAVELWRVPSEQPLLEVVALGTRAQGIGNG